MTNLKILSIGAGAIGTYIGGSLALAGHNLVFLERPETAGTISSMSITRDGAAHIIANPVFATSIEEALAKGPFDAALFATKSFDTASAMQRFAPYAAELPPFVCLQNGVENETVIAGVLGEEKVIHATVTTAIGKPGPGAVVVERLRGVGISKLAPTLRTAGNRLRGGRTESDAVRQSAGDEVVQDGHQPGGECHLGDIGDDPGSDLLGPGAVQGGDGCPQGDPAGDARPDTSRWWTCRGRRCACWPGRSRRCRCRSCARC